MTFQFSQIIGHRGAAGLYPENTLLGFEKAALMGVRMIEVDLRLSRDEQIYLMHDDDMLRMCGHPGSIEGLTSAEINQIRVRKGQVEDKIPTLEETLSLVERHNLAINLELKASIDNAESLVKALAQKLKQITVSHDKIIITSFDEACTRYAFTHLKSYARGMLCETPPLDWQERIKVYKLCCLILDARKNQATEIEKCVQTGIAVLGYTINDLQQAETLINLGMTGIYTDFPDRMEKWIKNPSS